MSDAAKRRRILAKLAADGVYRDGLRRGLTSNRTCARCHRAVLATLDPLIPTTVLVLDALPITVEGEFVAIMHGRHTYTHFGSSVGVERRLDFDMAEKSARKHIVLATHECGADLDTNWAMARKLYPTRARTGTELDKIPF